MGADLTEIAAHDTATTLPLITADEPNFGVADGHAVLTDVALVFFEGAAWIRGFAALPVPRRTKRAKRKFQVAGAGILDEAGTRRSNQAAFAAEDLPFIACK